MSEANKPAHVNDLLPPAAVGGFFPRPLQRLKARKRQEIVDGLVAKGRTKDQAEAIVNEIGDGKILEMLISLIGNLSKLIDILDDLFA